MFDLLQCRELPENVLGRFTELDFFSLNDLDNNYIFLSFCKIRKKTSLPRLDSHCIAWTATATASPTATPSATQSGMALA